MVYLLNKTIIYILYATIYCLMRASDSPTKSSAQSSALNLTYVVSEPKKRLLSKVYKGFDTQNQLTKILGCSKSNVSMHVGGLIKLNLLRKTIRSGTQFLELTEEGQKLAKTVCKRPKAELNHFVNHHNFRVELDILSMKSLNDWGFINRGTHKTNYRKFSSQGFNVEVLNGKVILYIYPIVEESPELARAKALDKIADAIDYLYYKHKMKLKPKFNTLTQHIGFVGTPLAVLAHEAGLHYKGKLMHCDFSNRKAEQEWVRAKLGYDDARFWAKTEEERVQHRISPLKEHDKLAFVVDTMHDYSLNMAAHVTAIQELAVGVREMRQELTIFRKLAERKSWLARAWENIKKVVIS